MEGKRIPVPQQRRRVSRLGRVTHRSNSLSGFSLIELLVAVMLIIVGSIATLTMQRAAVKQNNLTRDREVAAWLARQLVETVRRMRYADTNLNTTNGFVAVPAAVLASTNLDQYGASGSGIYQRQWSISSSATNIKDIQIAVSWRETNDTDRLVLRAMLKVR